MKLSIDIDPALTDDWAEFHLRELTPEMDKAIKSLSSLDFRLVGTLEDLKYQLDMSKLTTIYASVKKVYALADDKTEYQLSQTLSALSEKLPRDFLRISNSEIVNAKKIKVFDFTFGGKIKVTFANGYCTYSSRSYLKKIKEYFGL